MWLDADPQRHSYENVFQTYAVNSHESVPDVPDDTSFFRVFPTRGDRGESPPPAKNLLIAPPGKIPPVDSPQIFIPPPQRLIQPRPLTK